MNSVISEMPGPDVLVKARAPFQPAPITMPIEASSSSACTMAYLALPVSLSWRSRLQCDWNASDGSLCATTKQRPEPLLYSLNFSSTTTHARFYAFQLFSVHAP